MNIWQFLLHNHTEVLELTLEHLWLVGASTFFARAQQTRPGYSQYHSNYP